MNATQEVKVWDPLVRIFHWSLVIAFFIAYFTEEDQLRLHVWAGYTVLGLIVFRLVWGFIGPRYAQFTDFIYPPAQIMAYFKALLRREDPRYLGHNPAGGVMILALLVILLLTCLVGLALYGIEEHAGPLAGLMAGASEQTEETLEEAHEFLANLAMLLVVFHVVGVIAESLIHRENLIRAMFTGRKRPL